MDWLDIKYVKDNDKFYSGLFIKILPTKKGLAIGYYIPREGLIYILSENREGYSILPMVCLSEGELGNVCTLLKKEDGEGFVLGSELKYKLDTDLNKTFICKYARIKLY